MKRNKKIVEIYFVLYIAAIIFLLPDGKNIDSNKNLKETEFISLQPLKTTLFCRYYFDSTDIKIISLDSINVLKSNIDLNYIDFDFEIEDLSLKQKQFIEDQSTFFRFMRSMNPNELIFKWNPQFKPNLNKTYILSIYAYKQLRSSYKKEYIGQTQFSLLLIDVTNEIAANRDTFRISNQIPNILSPDFSLQRDRRISDITIEAHNYDIKSLAYRIWNNKIYIFGANPSSDLKQKPIIKVTSENKDNLGTCEIKEITNNSIILQGKTPIYGKMKVTISLKFAFENNIRTIDFYVSALPIPKPDIPSIIYPFKDYKIDPKLPFITEQKTFSILKLDGQKFKTAFYGEIITINMDEKDIGKNLILERYVEDELYDKYSIPINDYPPPIIYDIQLDFKDKIRIITNCYGYYKNEMNLVRLETKGNVTVRELRGKIQKDNDVFIQVFECVPKNTNEPFEFSVQAIDKRGQKSVMKKFP